MRLDQLCSADMRTWLKYILPSTELDRGESGSKKKRNEIRKNRSVIIGYGNRRRRGGDFGPPKPLIECESDPATLSFGIQIRGEAGRGVVVQWEIIPMLEALFSMSRLKNGPGINLCTLISQGIDRVRLVRSILPQFCHLLEYTPQSAATYTLEPYSVLVRKGLCHLTGRQELCTAVAKEEFGGNIRKRRAM